MKTNRNSSKFLSFILRHQPDSIGLRLDEAGWADIDELIACARSHGTHLSRELIYEVVAENDKQRFALDAERQRIRANQGHSIKVELGLAPTTPPEVLYHGTASRFLHPIRSQGLIPGSRQQVHLSATTEVARSVGARHGFPVVLVVRAGDLARQGHAFYLADNGVWLTDEVPCSHIEFPTAETPKAGA